MTLKMEYRKAAEVPAKRHQYSIPVLIEIGCHTEILSGIAKFSVDAIQAGIITGPGQVLKAMAMPLGELPLNRDRGWSVDSRDSMEDYVVFPGSGGVHPRRQPRNAPSEARAQADQGFARFLKQHSSPTHQRVTAGGRIVPMEPNPAPPQFNLVIDNSGRSKHDMKPQRKANDQKIGNPRSLPDLNMAVSANANFPFAASEHNQQTFHLRQGQDGSSSSQGSKLNTGFNLIDRGGTPRPSDLAYLTSTNSTALPETFTNFSSSTNFNPEILTHNQWATPVLPLSGLILNPYHSMAMPGGEQRPILPMSMAANAPFSAVPGLGQMSLPVGYGESYERLVQEGSQASFTTNPNFFKSNPATANMPVSFPSSLAVHNRTSSITSPPVDPTGQIGGQIGRQIGGHLHAAYPFQASTTDMQLKNLTINHSYAQPNNVMPRAVTKEEVSAADDAFRSLDVQLQGHDQFTACNHSSITPPMKAYYAKQRLSLAEQRDKARQKLTKLRCAFEEERSNQISAAGRAYHQKWSNAASASAQKIIKGNANLNVQAAAWVPGQSNTDNGLYANSQHMSNVTQPIFSKAATHAAKTPAEQASFAQQVSMQVLKPYGKQQDIHSITASAPPPAPGPYTKQLNNLDGELSDMEVDEWGARRGRAPFELGQKQSREEMEIRAQQHGGCSALIGSGLASCQPNIVPATLNGSPHPVDEWGERLGRAPAELGKVQNEQNVQLARMAPQQRSQISLATLDRGLWAKPHGGKTVTFAENNANTAYGARHDPVDDASSAGSSDETGWRPMQPGHAPPPTQLDWQVVLDARNKEKGIKTTIELAKGISVTVDGMGSSSSEVSTAEEAESDRNERAMLEQERVGIDSELASLARGFHGLEIATRNQGGPGFNPWAYQDVGNPFRNKGPSSVALQSITALGMMPAADGASNHTGQQEMNAGTNVDQKAYGSPFQASSPPRRSLRDIWRVPPRHVQVEAAIEEEEMSSVETVLYKY